MARIGFNGRAARVAMGAMALAAALAVIAPAAWAAEAAGHKVELSDRDRADIKQAETYLNGIATLKARFLQISDSGAQSEGTAYLSRPGKMRLQYDPPSPLLVLADGSFLIVLDKTVENPSYIPLGSTPAGILVRSNVQLSGKDLAVVRVRHQPGVVAISVIEADDPGDGELTLIFAERPFELKQWRIVDAQSQVTTVSLFDIETGLRLDPSLFEYKDPAYGRPKL